MKAKISIFVALLLTFIPNMKSLTVTELAQRLNWKSVLLLGPTKQINQTIQSYENSDIKLTWLPLNNKTNCEQIKNMLRDTDNIVINIIKSDSNKVKCLLQNLSPFRLLLVTEDQEKWFDYLGKLEISSGLYLFDSSGNVLWSLITMRGRNYLIRNKIKQTEEGFYATENYNLQGAVLTTYTLPYFPFLAMTKCDDQGMNCQTEGILTDMFNILQTMYNFTMVAHKADSWGAIPAYGSYSDGNPVFVGALGHVANGTCEFGLSSWYPTRERADYIDFSMGFTHNEVETASNRLSPPLDVTLFLRPFTTKSWILIFAFITLIASVLIIPPWTKSKKDLISHRIVIISSWLFFLLINAYYGGALTMFFSSSPKLPFSSAREGLLLYPDWKMTIPASDQVLLHHSIHEVKDPPYVEFYERSLKPGQTEILPIEEALKLLEKPGRFIYAISRTMRSQIKKMHLPNVELQTISNELGTTGALIINKKSPFTKMINKGIQRMRQIGALDIIHDKWDRLSMLQSEKGSFSLAEASPLHGRQAGLVFFIFTFAGVTSLVILILECLVVKLVKMSANSKLREQYH